MELCDSIHADLARLRSDFHSLTSRVERPFESFKVAWRNANFSRVHLARPNVCQPRPFTQGVLFAAVRFLLATSSLTEDCQDLAFAVFALYTLYHTQTLNPKVPIRVSPETCIKLTECCSTLMADDALHSKEALRLFHALVKGTGKESDGVGAFSWRESAFDVCVHDAPPSLRLTPAVESRTRSASRFPLGFCERQPRHAPQPPAAAAAVTSPLMSEESYGDLVRGSKDYAAALEGCGLAAQAAQEHVRQEARHARLVSSSSSSSSAAAAAPPSTMIAELGRAKAGFDARATSARRFADSLLPFRRGAAVAASAQQRTAATPAAPSATFTPPTTTTTTSPRVPPSRGPAKASSTRPNLRRIEAAKASNARVSTVTNAGQSLGTAPVFSGVGPEPATRLDAPSLPLPPPEASQSISRRQLPSKRAASNGVGKTSFREDEVSVETARRRKRTPDATATNKRKRATGGIREANAPRTHISSGPILTTNNSVVFNETDDADRVVDLIFPTTTAPPGAGATTETPMEAPSDETEALSEAERLVAELERELE